MSQIRSIVFDCYGTLFNFNRVTEVADKLFPGRGHRISQLIREKQIDYTWIYTLTKRYDNFLLITDNAISFALEKLGLENTLETRTPIVEAFLSLHPYKDVSSTLSRLIRHYPLHIFSDGTPEMLQAVISNANFNQEISKIMSVDPMKAYKPYLDVYQIPERTLKEKKEHILFVAAHPWDIAGASLYGYPTCWINRKGDPFDKIDVTPDFTIDQLGDILNIV